LAILIAAFLWLNRPLPQPLVTGIVPITNDGRANGAPILADGTRLLFNLSGTGLSGKEPRQVSVKGGEPVPLSLSMQNVFVEDMSPDRTELLVSREVHFDGTLEQFELWVLPVSGASPRRLGNLIATHRIWLGSGTGFPIPRRAGYFDEHQSAVAWSPDGQQLVYARESELHLARSDGSEVRKLATVDGYPFFVRWAPDGRRLRVSVSKDSDTTATLWEVSIGDGRLRSLFPGWDPSWYTCCGNWTADGRYYVFQSRANIWALREKTDLVERSGHEPVQLTHGPMAAYWPHPSVDGKRIFFAGYQARNEFVRYELQSGRYTHELPGISGDNLEFSRDGKWVTYVSVPGGSLFRAASDGSQLLQLTSPPLIAGLPHWSPDGKQIAFTGHSAGGQWRVYLVAIDGSGLRQVTNGESGKQGDCDPSWSPDGGSLAFGAAVGDSRGHEVIRVVDLKTGQVSVLPGSEGMWSPRWSPDGRAIAGLSEVLSVSGDSVGSKNLLLYEIGTRKQIQLFDQPSDSPSWSWDGDYVLFNSKFNSDVWCWTVRMRDRKAERLANLQKMRVASWGGLAAAPTNSFVIAVDAGTEEIYALEWKAP
jgi:Tol biopolymer transport system component